MSSEEVPPPPPAPQQPVLTEIKKRGSVILKAVPKPRDDLGDEIKAQYALEHQQELITLASNSELIQQLHDSHIPPPPPSHDDDDDDDDDVPPPPPSSLTSNEEKQLLAVPRAAFLAEVTQPKRRLSLNPVLPPKDGPSPHLLLQEQINKQQLPKLRKVPDSEKPKDGVSDVIKQAVLDEDRELEASLAQNSQLMSLAHDAEVLPAYPYSADELREAAEAKQREEELLVKAPAPEESGAPSLSVPADVNRVRRNSKFLVLNEISKPLAKLALNPVPEPVRPSIAEIVQREKEAEQQEQAQAHA